MAYVDLNPIRAGMAETPEESDFTSLQQRIRELSPPEVRRAQETPQSLDQAIPELLPFAGSCEDDTGLPFALDDYLALVDWGGRAIHPAKRGKIPDAFQQAVASLGRRFFKGISAANRLFAKHAG